MAKAVDPRNEIVRKNLVDFRKAAGFSQDGAAKDSGVPVDNLRRYELGRVVAPVEALRRLGEVYGHTVDDFLNPDPPPARLEDRPVFHLRTLSGVDIDPEILRGVEQAIRDANEKMRARKKAKKK